MKGSIRLGAVLAATVGLSAGFAHGAVLLDFEGTGNDGGEALSNTNTTTSQSFGVTNGAHALNVVSGPTVTLFDIGTVTGGSTGASLAHFNTINAGGATTGSGGQISFDITIDTTGVTSDGYFQLTLIGGGNNGYFQDGFGNLVNGNNIKSGLTLGTLATSQGATLTAITPFANGVGSYHFTIPLFSEAQYTAEANQHDPTFAANGSYAQLSLSGSGAYAGTVQFGVDNVRIGVPTAAPEPASLASIGLLGGAVLARRRMSR